MTRKSWQPWGRCGDCKWWGAEVWKGKTQTFCARFDFEGTPIDGNERAAGFLQGATWMLETTADFGCACFTAKD